MDSTLKKLVKQYLEDIAPHTRDNAATMKARGERIAAVYPKIFKEIVKNFDETSTSGNIEGGSANTIYLQTQVINGGNAVNI